MTSDIRHTFSGNPLDRAEVQRRDPNWLAEAIAGRDSRFLVFHKLKVGLDSGTGDKTGLTWLTHSEAQALGNTQEAILLGLEAGAPRFALAINDPDKLEHIEFADVRMSAASLAAADTGILAQARAQLDWHASNQFCGRCATPLSIRRGGQARHCNSCDRSLFPRTDPVVIMLISDGERCLLGQSAQRMPRMRLYSALAGFVDQGESIEEAVRREVREEAGIEVGAVSYHSSQPWPFPSSLMIGCLGRATSTEIDFDPEEMADVSWFDAAQIRKGLAGELAFNLPGPIAIAHHLIKAWLQSVE